MNSIGGGRNWYLSLVNVVGGSVEGGLVALSVALGAVSVLALAVVAVAVLSLHGAIAELLAYKEKWFLYVEPLTQQRNPQF